MLLEEKIAVKGEGWLLPVQSTNNELNIVLFGKNMATTVNGILSLFGKHFANKY